MRDKYRFDSVALHFTGDTPTAGDLAGALHESAGLKADAIASIRLLPQRIFIDLDARAARGLLTPHALRWSTGQGVLRRESDIPTHDPTYTVTVNKTFATAGEISTALFTDGEIFGEDIGVIRQTAENTSFDVPAWRYRHRDLPTHVGGVPATAEKKKSKQTVSQSSTHKRPEGPPLDVLKWTVHQQRNDAEGLRKAAHELVSRARYDVALNRSVRRLSISNWKSVETETISSPWAMVLRFALASSDTIEKYRTTLRQVTFPTEHHLETEDLLELLIAERLGEPHAIEPIGAAIIEQANNAGLETRVLGTFAPGARSKGLIMRLNATIPNDDDLMSHWLRVAQAVVCNSSAASDYLESVDKLMRLEDDLGAWEELYSLVRAEIEGTAAPLHTPLSVLEPQTDRYVEAVLAVIDEHISRGEMDDARSIAIRSTRERVDSSAIIARVLRLNGQTDTTADDPTVLLLLGERAWQAGQKELATSAFLSAEPRRGTLSSQHVARRLAWAGHLEEANNLLDDNSNESLRLNVALALERTEEATALWALSQGERLGLLPPPKWAPLAIRETLAPSLRSLLEGTLSLVSPADIPKLAPFLESLRTDPFAEWNQAKSAPYCSSALEAFLSTPDSHDALVSLADISVSLADEVELVKYLIAEVPPERWDPSGVAAWYALRLQGLNVPISISNKRLIDWFRDTRPEYRRAANLVVPYRKDEELLEAWNHTPSARMERAQAALADGGTQEARRITTALLSRAVLPQVRSKAVKLLLELGDDETVATMLSPARSAELQFDILKTIGRSQIVAADRKSIARALKLLANVSPVERVRNAVAIILAQNRAQ